MEELKNRILQDGLIIDNRILKVDNFLNQQIDPALVLNMGREFAKRFADCPIDRIVTIESSGIAIALAASLAMGNLPVVFARKKKSLLMQDAVYTASIYSYTKEETYAASISKSYLHAGERVLIIDDFLANGAALMGLSKLVEDAGATLVGAGIVIEKAFQPGGDMIRARGIRLESLARVKSMNEETGVEFVD